MTRQTPHDTSAAGNAASQPSQKSMTKAERRELQEKQRAAKLAQKQQQPGSGSAPSASKPKPPPSATKKQFGADATRSQQPVASSSKDLNAGAKDSAIDGGAMTKSRGLRIFSHFSIPKPVGQGIKGEIHPAIVRLGLQFSEFKICGSNARCIATLTAFKTVIFMVLIIDFQLNT